MAVSLDQRNLLRKYGQSQGIETERLLNQYSTSLTQNRETRPQSFEDIKAWRQTAFPNQALFFNAEEAAGMGIDLEEGWLLKAMPGEEGYKWSFITPQKWEITEEDLYISPEGEQYSRADMETLLAMPTGESTKSPLATLYKEFEEAGWITTEPLTIEGLTEEGQQLYQQYQETGGELDVAEWAEEQQRLYQEYQEEMQGLYQEYQSTGGELDFEGWLDLREQQYLEAEEIFGKVFPEQDISEVIAYMNEQPEQFLTDVREIGPTTEMVLFLKYLEFQDEEGNPTHLTDEEIAGLFGETQVEIPEQGMYIAEGIKVMPDYQVYSDTNPSQPIGEINRQTGEFEEREPRWWEKIGNVLQWLPPNIAGTLITKYGFPAIQKVDLPFMIQEQAHTLNEKQQGGFELTEAEQAFLSLYQEEVGNPPKYNKILAALHPAVTPAQIWKGAELSPSEELKKAYYDSTGTATQILQGITTPLSVALIAGGIAGGATAAEAGLARIAEQGGVRGGLATAGQVALKPVALYEQAVTTIMQLPIRLVKTAAQKAVLKMMQAYINDYTKWIRKSASVATVEGATKTVNNIALAIQAGTEITPSSLTSLIAKNAPKEFIAGLTNIVAGKAVAGVPEAVTPEVTPVTPEVAAYQQYIGAEVSSKLSMEMPELAGKVSGIVEEVTVINGETNFKVRLADKSTMYIPVDDAKLIRLATEGKEVSYPREIIPTTEVGMPEAGYQPSMIEGVPGKEVRPAPSAELVQSRLDDYLKLQEYEAKVAENRIAEIKETLAKKGRPPTGTRAELQIELARLEAQQELDAIKSVEELDHLITQVGEEIGLRSMPYAGYGGKSRIDLARHPTHRLFKGYTTAQLDEMLRIYQEARAKMEAPAEVAPEAVEVTTRRQLEGLGRMYQEWWGKRKTADETKVELARLVRETLPMDVRGKFVTAVAKVKTDAQLTTVMTKVMELAESNAQKVLRAEVRAELKKARAKIKDHILKGKFTPETQRLLDVLNHNLELDRDTAREKIVTNIKAYEAGELSYEEMFKANEALNFAGIDGMSSEELVNLLDYIKSLEAVGRSERQAKWEIATEKIKAIRADISNILTGGKGLKTGIGAISGKQLAAKPGWLDTFVNWQYGIDNLADKLSKFDTTSKPYQSVISKFVSKVHRATNRQFIGTKEAYSKIKDAVGDVFGVKGGRAINQVLNELDTEVNLGTFELTAEYIANHPGATTVTIKMTRNEMLAKYMQMQDSTLNDTFTIGMGWSTEVRNAIENNLTAEEKKLVDVFFQFYEDYYNTINPIYQELYNVDMPHNSRYSPIRRDFEGDIAENILTFQDAAQYASVLNGSLKARQKNIRPLRFNGATQILSNHIEQMEHFKAWAIIMRDMRRVFGNTEIRQAIEQYHGRGIVQLIDKFMNQMARGGLDTATTNRVADWLRRNFTRSILAIKPVIALKQIPSLFAYVSDQEMGVTGFVSGIADFWKSPIAHFQFLYKNSEGFRARIQAGFERDIAAALAQHGNKEIAGRGSIKNWFMLQIRLGDTFAVSQGMWAKYKDGLNKGLSQAEAIAAAEDLTNRTQPSFGIDTLSAIQNGGSWLKLMTMFQNQPNKYFRLIGDNLRNFKYGRGSRAKASGTILLAWVLLPMMFQFIADAFQWKPERQARAGILGPLNFILIGGQLVQSIWGWLTDQPFDYQVSPVAQTADDLRNIFLKAKKLISQGEDPYKDISLDDVAALVEYLAKAAGQVTGWPTPYLVQVEKDIRIKLQEGEDVNIKDFLFSQWALQPPAKNAEQKVEDLNLKLGEIKEGQEDKPLSERELNLYTAIDWFRDIGNVYSNVLPQDILDNPNASKESKAWAEYKIAHSQADILPDIPLYKINTEDNDDTIVQYYQQWKARERITSLAQLKEFDTLYPKAYLGNVTRQQYELLVKYLESDDKDAFLEAHPELRVNPRDEWLRANPLDNARLALAGQAKLLTLEAYNQFKGLLETLDIPTDAIPPITLPPEGSVENYFKYNEIGEEYGYNSAEVKLLLVEDDVLREWLGREPIDDHIEALKLKVKYRDLTGEYEGYGDRDSSYYIEDKDAREKARELFRENHPDWVIDMNRVDAYSLDFPDEQIENYVEYYELPDKGYRRERYLLENVDFYNSMIDLKGIVPFDTDYQVPDVRYDEIYEEYKDLFEEYENVMGTESERATERERILKRNPEFAKARREREGYYQFRSITGDKLHDLVQDYANYYLIEKKEGVDYSAGWYEDDWFLMEHSEFYNTMYELEIWAEPRDFSKVPTREVYALYQSYLALPVGYARTTFRAEHPELDDWLVLAKGYTAIGDRGKEEPSPWEGLLPWLEYREGQ